jgi:hypothetical protein
MPCAQLSWEERWWDTNIFSWSNRSTRVIEVVEAPEQSYTVSIAQGQRESTPKR